MLIIVVAATVPLVYAFTHHGRAREITLVLWLPFWLFVMRVVSPALGRWPAGASLEERLRWAAFALLTDPLTIVWPLLLWLIFFWRRRAARKSGRKDIESTEAMGQGAPSAEPTTLIVVVFLAIVMFVVALAADQADMGALPTQRAVVGTVTAQLSGDYVFAIVVVVISSLGLCFELHGQARIISLVLWWPFWSFATSAVHPVPTPWSNSLEGRLRWALNEFLTNPNPATILWPLYVFFVFALIRLFTGAPRPEVTTGLQSVPTPVIKQCLGCGRFVAIDERECPYCHYSFASASVTPTSAPSATPPPSAHGGEWCSHCGAPVRAEANFCARCGFELFKQR
jgi:RNA polymerase subunit RPABC4/transcription elongation factor Spt4